MVWNTFRYRGGVAKPNFWSSEKMLVFVVVGGKEVSLYQLEKEGLVKRIDDDSYQMAYDIVKLFVGTESSKFGHAMKMCHGFYIKLLKNDTAPIVTINPLDKAKAPHFYFSGRLRFLKTHEVENILTDRVSLKYLKKQLPLPKRKLLEMIDVDRSHLKRGIRSLKINPNKED